MIDQQIIENWLLDEGHLLLTGSSNSGKTYLIEFYEKEHGVFCGIKSEKIEERVMLYSRRDVEKRTCIGRFKDGAMRIQLDGFLRDAMEIIQACEEDILVIDEIGYLEKDVPSYLETIYELSKEKRLLLVLRKKNHALEISRLVGKVKLIDLDKID